MSARLAASYRCTSIVRVVGAVALSLCLAIAVTGCADDEGGTGAQTATSSGTPLPTPTGAPEGDVSDIGDLELGDCFTEPSGELVEKITKLPCDTAHDAEVYAVLDLPPSATFPGDDTAEAQADTACTGASDAIDEDKLPGSATIGYFFPTADNWSGERNTVQCYIATDDEPLVGSVRR